MEYAFPAYDGHNVTHCGMTLRDYFAAKALTWSRSTMPDYDLIAMFGKHRTGITRAEILAADAYAIADAMIAERNKS